MELAVLLILLVILRKWHERCHRAFLAKDCAAHRHTRENQGGRQHEPVAIEANEVQRRQWHIEHEDKERRGKAQKDAGDVAKDGSLEQVLVGRQNEEDHDDCGQDVREERVVPKPSEELHDQGVYD